MKILKLTPSRSHKQAKIQSRLCNFDPYIPRLPTFGISKSQSRLCNFDPLVSKLQSRLCNFDPEIQISE